MEAKDLHIKKILEVLKENSYDMGFWLDEYDDLFSDFDPRHYSKKQISDDFLFELKRRFREVPKNHKINVNLYLPKVVRNQKIEIATRKRIREHFEFEIKNLDKKRTKRKKTGIIYLVVGVAILATNAYIEWELSEDRLISLFGFILSPAGWFSTWTSFERFIFDPSDETEKREFYLRMQKTGVNFLDMEDVGKKVNIEFRDKNKL